MDASTEKLLLSKLRQPIHKTYICQYILRSAEQSECDKVLFKLVDEGKIIESKFAKDYYVVKNV
jgi:hypothetical protein